jgi:N-acyl-D-aspartate/D-glutamate deacylase
MLLAFFLLAHLAPAQTYDLVIQNGRVLDPESGLDAVRHLGIQGGVIRAVSERPLRAARVVDAQGLVVAPGFIDLHWHGRDPVYYRYPAMQGVTSALELEIGTADVAGWYARREGKSLIHYGVAAGHPPIRMALMKDPGEFLPSADAANRAATAEEISELKLRLERELKQGAVGVGFGIAYTQAAAYREIYEMFRVAARFGAVCHVHIRGGGALGREAGLSEVIAATVATGAPLHVVHINSSAGPSVDSLLEIIGEARKRGADITTEAYPYTAGATRIESALFNDWEKQPDSYFATLQWAATGERLTRESFARYRAQGGRVMMHSNTEENVRKAILSPLTMIASDGADLVDGTGHPRSAGTYPRVFAKYVREEKSLSLMDAVRKMTLMPAQRLEKRVPGMKNKGRIRVGADADLVLFDWMKIADRSTYEKPAEFPIGIEYVLVGGVPVVEKGKVAAGRYPGKPLRAAVQ